MIDESKLKEVQGAKKQIVEGSLIIWNARLESLVQSGDLKGALQHLHSPVEFGDNCGCNSGCGSDVLFREQPWEALKGASR